MMKKNRISILFVIPSLLFYTFIKIYPLLVGFYYSLTDSNGLRPDYNFVGFKNFNKLFQDGRFLNSIKVTFIYVIIVVTFVNVLGLIIAVLLNESTKLNTILRSTFFLPVLLSQVAIAYIWKVIYSYNGILDYILKFLNLEFLKLGWITDPEVALFSLCAVGIWRIFGFHMVIILSALQSIPQNLYEAASIDGASPYSKFKHITLPLVKPGLTVSIILSTIGTMKQFDIVKVLTDGGPMNSTDTISYFIIDQAFTYNLKGYAAAAAVILFFIILVIIVIQNNILSKKEVEY